MEHLALEIFDLDGKGGSKYAFLPENTSITITDTSEIFASGDVWSHSFTLNTHANAHIFGTAGEIHGSRLHEQINKRRARLWVEGLPLYLGYLKLDDEVDVDENGDVDVTFESGQKTFDEMIEGAKANQVPMMSDVKFGVALWRKRKVTIEATLKLSATLSGQWNGDDNQVYNRKLVANAETDTTMTYVADGEKEDESAQLYPRLVFPKGRFKNLATNTDDNIDCLNTDYPYDDAHPYCNTALCYQKYGYLRTTVRNGTTYTEEDYSSEPEQQRGYEVMPASRVNSAPNFFVIYWIKALMKHLGIYIEENQMMDVEDLRRLFFVNTNCAYREPKIIRGDNPDSGYTRYKFNDEGRLIAERAIENIKDDNLFGITSQNLKVGVATEQHGGTSPNAIYNIHLNTPTISVVSAKRVDSDADYIANNSYLHDAFATSECFPNVDISEVIQAIENGFGVRFLFGDNYQRVRIVLLRNIFNSGDVQEIACDIISDSKQENSIRGFRMTYGNSEDTHFYYKGFADKLPHKKPYFVDDSDKHDYSHWDLDADYSKLLSRISSFDKTCYVTRNNGNAYGIKVDKDAKRLNDQYPSLFEFAGYMDAEDGDCSGEDSTIKTINVGFSPAIMNDVNFEKERNGENGQRFALFVDATMRPRRPDLNDLEAPATYDDPDVVYSIDKLYAKKKDDKGNDTDEYVYKGKMLDGVVKPGEFAVTSDTSFNKTGASLELEGQLSVAYYIEQGESYDTGMDWVKLHYPVTCDFGGFVLEGYRLYLQDNFEPNDDGISPIEKHDWGLTLGIMRGSGSDAYVEYTADTIENEDPMNDTWERIAGSSITAHPDTCDSYGNLWDYDGSEITDSSEAVSRMATMFPNSNFDLLNRDSSNYLISTLIRSGVMDDNGQKHTLLFALSTLAGNLHGSSQIRTYVSNHLKGKSVSQMYAEDAARWGILIEVDSSGERGRTLVDLQRLVFANGSPMFIDNGVSSLYGRFSLKLRAEKPNPYFDPKQEESETNRRYLKITNPNLRGRGLADQFYKEYSYWIRNARIWKGTVRMELAQLLSIDKTQRVTVGDVTGFIRKMQYSVDNQSGLGNVTMEIMYI